MASSIDSEVRNMSGFSIGQIECTLSGNWWVFFIRGVLFVLLGALALALSWFVTALGATTNRE